MSKLKAVVIENDMSIAKSVRNFIEMNKDLFESVDTNQIACMHRPLKDLARFISISNALIFESTFTVRWQLKEMVNAFLTGPFSSKEYTFFIFNACSNLNYAVQQNEEIKDEIINLVLKNNVNTFDEKGKYKLITYNSLVNSFEEVN